MEDLMTAEGKVRTVHGLLDPSDIPVVVRETLSEKNMKLVMFFVPIIILVVIVLLMCYSKQQAERHRYIDIDEDWRDTKKRGCCVPTPCELMPPVSSDERLYANDGQLAIKLSQLDEEYVPYFE
jgi:hypothetical protein